MGAVMDEPLIVGAGTPEAAWQSWPFLARVGGIAIDDLLATDSRLVVIAPHPDDEVLACGALLAKHAARGGACCVIAVTDGEASHAGSRLWGASRLAVARRAESASGLSLLGCGAAQITRLGLPDSQVDLYGDHLAFAIKRLLQPGDTVITTWRQDGHPDHDATGSAAARACLATGCRLVEAPVWTWHWARPGDSRVPWHRLRALHVGGEAQTRKRHALMAHVSQLLPRDTGEGPVLGAGILERLGREIEYFFV